MDYEEVTQAIKSSRYNETVVVHVKEDGDEPSSREILLIPCLDETNGGIVWNDLAMAARTASISQDNGKEDNYNGDDVGIVRHLRTKRWFFPMLNHQQRNELYERAIRAASYRTVRRQFRNGQQPSAINPLRVLDIGTGTGLLAMMAAKYIKEALFSMETKFGQAQPQVQKQPPSSSLVQITSLEMSAAMSRLARLTIADNQLQDVVTVHEQHSTDLPNNHLAQMCVSELLESSLLGEGILPSIRDAWERRLLAPDAIVVPQKARVYCQWMEGAFLRNYWGPHSNSNDNKNNNDNPCGDGSRPPLCFSLSSSSSGQDVMLHGGDKGGIILHIHAENWMDLPPNNNDRNGETPDTFSSTTSRPTLQRLKPLSEPFHVMDFDFANLESLPSPQGRSISMNVMPHTSGTVHGVLFWWELDLCRNEQDPGEATNGLSMEEMIGSCTLSTQPGKEAWQDHWQQNLFIFTNRTPPEVSRGELFEFVASHDDSSLWFSIQPNKYKTGEETSAELDNLPTKRIKRERKRALLENVDGTATLTDHNNNNDGNNRLISPLRACQLNNYEYKDFLRRGILVALKSKGKDAPFLDMSDFSLCAILAGLEGATQVSSLESSSGVIPQISARVAQFGNSLPYENNRFQILQCYAEHLSLELLNTDFIQGTDGKSPPTIEIVAAEPYYEMLEGWHLQEALNYYYLVRALRERHIISQSAMSVPCVALIKGCAIQSHQLRSAYQGCGNPSNGKVAAQICGFDHRGANHYGDRFGTYDLSLPLSEYSYVELTEPFDIATLPYDNFSHGSRPLQFITTRNVPFQREGTCHGMIAWIDYGIRREMACFADASNGPETRSDALKIEFHSTLGACYRQLVRMMEKPLVLKEDNYFLYEFVCHAEFGNQPYLESHTFDLSTRIRSKASP